MHHTTNWVQKGIVLQMKNRYGARSEKKGLPNLKLILWFRFVLRKNSGMYFNLEMLNHRLLSYHYWFIEKNIISHIILILAK